MSPDDGRLWLLLSLAIAGRFLLLVMGSGSEKMVKPAKALPGRADKMPVADKHYVLGTPMEGPWPSHLRVLVAASGCFWGAEKGLWRLPGGGVHSTAVGYAAGFTPNPTYEEVGTGRTGSTEAVQVVYDPERIGAVDILRWFWESHDPTQGMGQGGDRGTMYRSGLYYFDDDDRRLFEASRAAYGEALRDAGKGQGPITTEVQSASDYDGSVFYYAEDYHQQYLAKPGARPYCSAMPQEVSLPPYEEWAPADWPAEKRARYAPKLPEQFWEKHGPKPHSVVRMPHSPIKWPREL